MHPLTSFFRYLEKIDFRIAPARDHLDERQLTEWYPDWYYEFMETDEVRNRPYRETIRETVAGKVVLDVGTGRKAIWAACCARAGAKSVYAIEANERAYRSSRRFLRSRGIHNVHLIHGFSDKITLPERCEVLVHEIVGCIGSSEGMVAFVEDARRRLLTAEPVLIPRRCTTYLLLVEDPQLHWTERAFTYAMNGLRGVDSFSFFRYYHFPPSAVLSRPHVFEDVMFCQDAKLHTEKRFVVRVVRDGLLRGVCFCMRLHVSETRVVDTWNSKTSWSNPYIRFKTATPVRAGDRVEVATRSDLSGHPSYSVTLTHQAGGTPAEIGRYAWAGD
jgi:protein arginine N-methyltransferase 1